MPQILSGWQKQDSDSRETEFREAEHRPPFFMPHQTWGLYRMETVKLIGSDVLPEDQKLTMEIAKVIRVGFLQQNAYHADDTYVPLEKQYKMLKVISYLNSACIKLVNKRIPVSLIAETGVFELLIKIKYDVPNDNIALLDTYPAKIDELLAKIV